MEFKQLEAFAAVVEYGSFSLAAKHLYLTQPTISAHIKSLEEELKTTLIIRTTKKLTITERGYQLYDYVSRLLQIRNNMLEDFTGEKKKTIELGVSSIPSSYILPDILCEFQKKIENVYINAWQSDSQEVIKKVAEGSLDVGLVGICTNEPGCCFHPFCKDELVIVTPATGHFLAYQNKLPELDIFLKEPVIMRENGSGTKKEIERILEELGKSIDDCNIIARMNDLEAIKQSIVRGVGISIMSLCSVKNIADSKKVLLFPFQGKTDTRSFYIVYNQERIVKPHVKEFISFVRKFY